MPPHINSDHLTVLGIIGAVLIGLGYFLCNRSSLYLIICEIGLFLNWFGDSLDGTLARIRHKERKHYGYFIDHMVDTFCIIIVALGLGSSPLIHMNIALLMCIVYLAYNVYVHIITFLDSVFKISFGIIGPTEIRIVIFIVNILLIFLPPSQIQIWSFSLTIFDIVGIALCIIFTIVLIYSTLKDAARYNRLDTRR